jgi:hypothetical protein
MTKKSRSQPSLEENDRWLEGGEKPISSSTSLRTALTKSVMHATFPPLKRENNKRKELKALK